ncbi:hypothetical protein LMG6003_04673 [Achromobacter insolitus]|nr:hypothetical protein LMG6003_04673 [Achromobacter insolitus]
MPLSLNVTPSPSVTVLARRDGPPVPAFTSRMVPSAKSIFPATASVAGPCTDNVLLAPATRRSPVRLLATPTAPSPYCNVPPVTSAEPPSEPSTTSLPPDTVVLPLKPLLAPDSKVVPATWLTRCEEPLLVPLSSAAEKR